MLNGCRIRQYVNRLFLIPAVLTFFSCINEEGQGGTGSISGKIMEQSYNDDYSSLIIEKPAVDEEVFILFGEDNVLGDRVFTGITGEFRFDFLFPGRYYIYYKTEDSATVLNEEREKINLVVLDRGEEADLGNLVKLSTLDYDDGAAVITGEVKVIDYVDESRWPNLIIEEEYFAHEQEVFIRYGSHTYFDDRIRTQYDGRFEFRDLIPGDYQVFLYSDDARRINESVVLKFEITITEMDQVVDLGLITIEKL